MRTFNLKNSNVSIFSLNEKLYVNQNKFSNKICRELRNAPVETQGHESPFMCFFFASTTKFISLQLSEFFIPFQFTRRVFDLILYGYYFFQIPFQLAPISKIAKIHKFATAGHKLNFLIGIENISQISPKKNSNCSIGRTNESWVQLRKLKLVAEQNEEYLQNFPRRVY